MEVAGGRIRPSQTGPVPPCFRELLLTGLPHLKALEAEACIGQRGQCSAVGGGLRQEIASGPIVRTGLLPSDYQLMVARLCGVASGSRGLK